MTDRGFPIVDGAPACPFVAFEEDRDGRATAPDHRHRCFAEPRPAPRALAHQEAYCLSSAFPVCPTFQDWARREAAIARSSRPAASEAHEDDEAPAAIVPGPPPDLRERDAPAATTPPPIPPRRPPSRDWAAPPPWAGDGAVDPGGDPYAAAAAAGSAAARSPGEDVAPPAFLAPKPATSRDDDWGAASRGLAGSAADRLAGPDPDADDAASYAARPSADGPGDDDAWEPRAASPAPSAPPPAGRAPSPPVPGRRAPDRPPAATSRRAPARHPEDEPADLFGPAFGRPHRYEAYPTLRTRVGLPRVSGPAMAIVALVFAGATLFFLGPMLLGIGGDEEAARATPSPTIDASARPSPTLPPAPTPKIYIVVKNDKLAKIAERNGVTLEALLAANPQIKNPNRIKVGDQITIPVPEVEEAPEEVVESTVP